MEVGRYQIILWNTSYNEENIKNSRLGSRRKKKLCGLLLGRKRRKALLGIKQKTCTNPLTYLLLLTYYLFKNANVSK